MCQKVINSIEMKEAKMRWVGVINVYQASFLRTLQQDGFRPQWF